MNLLYFVLGNSLTIHMQDAFSIRTILAHAKDNDEVFVVTDTPVLYEKLPVRVVPVTRDTIREWEGPHHFFWRTKIMAMKTVMEMSPGKALMYLDGDTVVSGDFEEIRRRLDSGICMMHKDEGCPGDMAGASLKMWKQIEGRTYDGITIGREHHMWNAGIVAIPQQCVEMVVNSALRICDGMLAENVEPIVIEQYSLSIAQKERGGNLIPADDVILHYWPNKVTWSFYIGRFFAVSYASKRTLDEELRAIRNTDFNKLNKWLLIQRTWRKLMGKVYK